MSDNPYATTTPMEPEQEKTWAVLTNVISIFFEVLAPLVAFIVLKGKGPFITHHVTESINFAITMLLAAIILVISIVGWLIIWALPVYAIIFRIIAAVKASQGEFYRFPLIIRFVK